MEYYNITAGDCDMCVSDGELDILFLLKWGYRALYVLLFIALITSMGYLHLSFAIAYLGAIMSLLFVLIFSEKELFYYWAFSYLLDEEEGV